MRQQFIEVAEMANSEVPSVADLVEIFSSESDNCCRLAVAPRRLVFRVALKSAWPGRKINDAHRTVTAWPVTAEPKSMAPEPRLVFFLPLAEKVVARYGRPGVEAIKDTGKA